MNRSGKVYYKEILAGKIAESDEGYTFAYDYRYLDNKSCLPISQTLPKRRDPYISKTMIPFFDGLIPEGWLLVIASENWKIDTRDRMGLLLTCCKDCIGAVSVIKNSGESRSTT